MITTKNNNKLNVLTSYFTYWPVGQGLFYTGQIANFTFVYDCGVKGNATPIHKSIDIFSGNHKHEVIDILFLSHYDQDHISAIQYLTKNKKIQIKKIIAPLITPHEELTWFLNSSEGNLPTDLRGTIAEFLGIDREELDNYNGFIQASPLNDNVDPQPFDTNLRDVPDIRGTFKSKEKIFNTTLKYKKLGPIWEFIFYAQGYSLPEVRKWMIHFLIKVNLDSSLNSKNSRPIKNCTNLSTNEISKLIYQKIKRVINESPDKNRKLIVDKVTSLAAKSKKQRNRKNPKKYDYNYDKFRNVVSLTLFHQPVKETYSTSLTMTSKTDLENTAMLHATSYNGHQLFYKFRPDIREFLLPSLTKESKKSGQLLTGDSVFIDEKFWNSKQIWDNFSKIFPYNYYSKFIGLALVPHHGATDGWRDDFLNYSNVFVVSFGLGNQYRHPNTNTVNSFISEEQKLLIPVTQLPFEGLTFFIDIVI